MTRRRHRAAAFLLGAAFVGLAIGHLVREGYVEAAFNLTFGVFWILMGFVGDRYQRWGDDALERQRSRVRGFNAISFQPDPDSRAQDE